jgi:hypothetical protein
MPMTPAAAKKYKPRRTPESLDEVIYPETRVKMEAAKAEVADTKASTEAGAEYNKSLTTENKAKGGMTAKFMSFSKKGKPAGMKSVTKMASGGSASSRADGIAVKGKTRGTMC